MFPSFDDLPGGLSDLLDAIASIRPELELEDAAGTFAIGDLVQRSRALASGLAAWGVEPGDRVGVIMRNRREWLETWFAVARVGAVIVPVNTRFTLAETDYVLRHGGVRWLVWRPDDGAVDAVSLDELERGGLELAGRAVVDAEPAAAHERPFEDLAAGAADAASNLEDGGGLGMIQYTSGSTAFPKGAMLRNAGLVRNGYGLGRAWRLEPDDRVLVSNPLFHCGGSVFSFMAGLTHGCALLLTPGWRVADAVALMEERGVTVAPVIDAAVRDLVAHARAGGHVPRSLRLVSTAANRDLFEQVVDLLHCDVSNVYGLTECSPNVCVGALADSVETRLAHIGRPQPGIDVSIRDPDSGEAMPLGAIGEIVVDGGLSMMLGYYADPEATVRVFTDDGYLRTGDLGRLHEDGCLDYCGRVKLMIKSGGENIAIEEVEEALRAHAAIVDAIVVPIPHERFVEVGFAYLRRLPGVEVDAEEVLAASRDRLAGFKVPKGATIVDDLPRTGSGKVDRTALAVAGARLTASPS